MRSSGRPTRRWRRRPGVIWTSYSSDRRALEGQARRRWRSSAKCLRWLRLLESLFDRGETVMKVGFIGAGRMATTIGRHLIGAGHEVVLSSSRGPDALAGLVANLGPAASAGFKQKAAECDVVILATNWADAPEALKGISWGGRILVDGTNAHMGEKPDISAAGVARSVAAFDGRTSSEIVAAIAPGARLRKSLSNMP